MMTDRTIAVLSKNEKKCWADGQPAQFFSGFRRIIENGVMYLTMIGTPGSTVLSPWLLRMVPGWIKEA